MSMWGAAGAEDSIISNSGEPEPMEGTAVTAIGTHSDNESQSPTKQTEPRDSNVATPMRGSKMEGFQTER